MCGSNLIINIICGELYNKKKLQAIMSFTIVIVLRGRFTVSMP